MKPLESMRDLFIHELQDVHNAEKQLLKALPKLATQASSKDLKTALNDHKSETQEHVHRLEECFKKLGEKLSTTECKAMKGIVAEAEETVSEAQPGDTLDAAIIAVAQKAEHYEIATYGTVTEWAKSIGQDEVARILGTTLGEEEKADELLTKLARKGINRAAA